MVSSKNKQRRPRSGQGSETGSNSHEPEIMTEEGAAAPETEAAQAPRPTMAARQASLQLERIGDILKHAREQRREKIAYISDYLRIRSTYLIALEESHYEELPADAYVIGFLRTYANYLGLDGRVAIDQYRKEMAGRRRKPQLSMPQPISEGQTPSAAVMLGAVGAVFVLYILWYMFSGTDTSDIDTTPKLPETASSEVMHDQTATISVGTPAAAVNSVPAALGSLPSEAPAAPTLILPAQQSTTPAPSVTPPAPKTEQPATTPTPEKTAPSAAAAPEKLVITADKESWVLIVDAKGSTVFDRVLKTGETYKVPDQKGLRLTTGNAGGIVLKLGDAELPRLGDPFRVVRSVDLDAQRLKNQAGTSVSAPQ